MRHSVIVTGGHLNIAFAKEYLKTLSYDKVFAVDKGLEYVEALGLQPDYIVGDFDTVDNTILDMYKKRIENGILHAILERHPAKKDATDTELALNRAMEDADQITILGATGNRLDHVLANLGLLLQTANKGVECYIVDETNRIRLLVSGYNRECVIPKKEQFGTYLSLIPMTASLEQVTLEGVMYPLKEQRIDQGSSLTISNQIVDDKAIISIKGGNALVIESKDFWQ